MKIGTFCFSTRRGLGHLARDFYQHGVITHPLVVLHDAVPNERWYPGAPATRIQSVDRDLLREFVADKDAMLFFETPIYWPILHHCRRIGVRTYIVSMYECTPEVLPGEPHRWICPSLLDLQYFPSGVYLPLPVEYPWELRTTAKHFVHNGGYLGHHGREGTTLLIEAMRHVQSDLRLTIRSQESVGQEHLDMILSDPRIEYRVGTFPHEELYGEGQVAVMPQKYNGCSVPIQEALASGMAVMTTDRYPMNMWLPREPLIPTRGSIKTRIANHLNKFDEAVIDPADIARCMDGIFGQDVSALSDWGRKIAAEYSWESLRDRWLEVLSR